MKMTMSQLFSPFTLRSLTLENRVVVSPMCQYICNGDGQMHDWHLMHLGQLAMGGAGLLFTEATHVSAVGRISPRCAGLWNDAQEAAMKRRRYRLPTSERNSFHSETGLRRGNRANACGSRIHAK